MRKVFSDVIDADAAFKVLATACDGEEAVSLALELKPDIITMDLEMPRMNGLEALQKIMKVKPTPVIMLSAVTDNGTRDTIRALQYGAIDFIRKPDGAVKLDIRQVGEQLLEKLHIAMESMNSGLLRMLPAVEDKATESPSPELRPPVAKEAPLPKAEQEQATLSEPDLRQTLPGTRITSAASAKPTILPKPLKPKRETELRKPAAALPPRPNIGKLGERKPVEASGLRDSRDKDSKPPIREEGVSKESRKETKPGKQPANPITVAAPIAPPPTVEPKVTASFTDLVAIGTSTGGPRALHEVLTGIPSDFPAPILVVQHMPPKFTNSLAQRLDSFCSIHVREAKDGEVVETATAYIAPGGRQMSLSKDTGGKYRIKLSDEGPRSGHMPSVDFMFESLIGQRQLKRHAVLMTGMGSDGAKGMLALRQDGAQTTIAEAEQTCVVYGMPRSAVELGAATHQLPLQGIAPALVQEVKFRKS
jgi:two-component system chemotaxis response regulator CheB